MNCYTYEEQKEQAVKTASAYRDIANHVIPGIIPTVKSFDGKVYNCRFDKALKEKNNNIYVQKNEYSITVNAHYQDFRCNVYGTIFSMRRDDMSDKKRLDANKIIGQLRENQEYFLKRAYDIENYIDDIPQIKSYIEEMVEKINLYCEEIPSDIKHIFDVPFHVRKYW